MQNLYRPLLMLFMVFIMMGCDRHRETEQALAREELNPPAAAYVSARACSAEDLSCLSLIDLYERKPGFKESVQSAFSGGDMSLPPWFSEGLTTRLIRKTQGSDTYVMGRTCEPRNCAQFLYLAQNERSGDVYGFYRSNEQMLWFGQADDAEKALLCSDDQYCQLEARKSEIPELLNQLALPELTQLAGFTQCQEYKGGLSNLDGFVCRDQFIAQCAYSSAGCTVSSEFVGVQLAKISFKYKYRQLKYDELKMLLDKRYGKSEVQVIKPDTPNGSTAWVSGWSAGNVDISARRVKGKSAQGTAYDDFWLVLSEKGFVLFNTNPK